jgi:prevent-host-death family protein
MLDIAEDIQAMTFRRNPGRFMKHLRETERPIILTINGKAEAVVQDARAYQICWIWQRKPTLPKASGRASKT